ncbi:MAG: hypothetical protein ACMG6E_09670 [Candidatus Roizmanbacteria bacterium]
MHSGNLMQSSGQKARKQDDHTTPNRSAKNKVSTFYSQNLSDGGSFTTTSTSIADKLKVLKQNKRNSLNQMGVGV